MTENEKMLIERQEELLNFAEQMLYYAKTKNNEKCTKIYSESKKASETIIKAFEELEQYRAIGTVEECREARERRNGKKPYIFFDFYNSEKNGCPNYHENNERNEILYAGQKYCSVCGQAIDWAE